MSRPSKTRLHRMNYGKKRAGFSSDRLQSDISCIVGPDFSHSFWKFPAEMCVFKKEIPSKNVAILIFRVVFYWLL